MKRFSLLISICLLVLSCTKTLDQPFSPSSDTASESARKTKVQAPQDSILSYTLYYTGVSDANFAVNFPAFKVIYGILSTWKVTISRKVYGTATFANTLATRNDSNINVLRYSLITAADTPYITYPEICVSKFKQSLKPYQSVTIPISLTVQDEFNSSNSGFLNVYSNEVPNVQLGIRDLVTLFKANCNNSYNLQDSTTVTLTYYYQADHNL
jgi:hypothetical protein